ncbi:MAG: hypothetical protein ACYDBQ_04960 [Thermoplasmatota archaeon]
METPDAPGEPPASDPGEPPVRDPGERPATAPGEPPARRAHIAVENPVWRDLIIEHLRTVGEDSISGVTRALSGGRERPIHRLTIAGYLQALAEAGVLKEVERPPSKDYQLQDPQMHWSLHQRIFRALAGKPERERLRLALAALQVMLARPIFQAELLHAGFLAIPERWEGVERVTVPDNVRRHYKELFERRSSPHIEVPARDPLLQGAAVAEVLRRITLKATGAEHLAWERPVSGPPQASLDQVGAA